MSINTVYINAETYGLVKWDDFKKPPYTAQEYLDAYNNGIRITQAINTASTNGASKVVLERGRYPVCYTSSSRHASYSKTPNLIDGTTDLEIDGNGSCLFVIYDSINYSPYQIGDALNQLQPYQLPGAVLDLRNNTNLYLHGLELRGDQYNRSWVTGENWMEQTYGILLNENNYNTKIDVISHGFRGDSVSTKASNSSAVASLTDNWSSGGLSSSGEEIEEEGAYRSARIDLQGHDIKRNSVQIMTHGGVATMQNRDDRIGAYFFKADGSFISRETVWQTEFIYLPKDCAFIQLVCYGDERTDPVVGYGVSVNLVTGCSDFAEIRGEHFANHRGAVSNLCNNTTVDADIHDIGTTKYGFPHYNNATRYGIDFENIYVSKLTVRGSIRNVGSAILANCRQLDVDGCTIKNTLSNAFATYGSKEVNIKNCVVDNIGYRLWECSETTSIPYKRHVRISNNIFKNSTLGGSYTEAEGLLIDISGNIFSDSLVWLRGNWNNIVFNHNIIPSSDREQRSLGYACFVDGAAQAIANTWVIERNTGGSPSQKVSLSARTASNNVIINTDSGRRVLGGSYIDIPNYLNGTEFEGSFEIRLPTKENAEDLRIYNMNIDNCKFLGALQIGLPVSQDYNNTEFKINNTEFNDPIALMLVDVNEGGSHKFTFKNCTFNLSGDNPRALNTNYVIKGRLDIEFIECTFIKDTPSNEFFKVFGKTPKTQNTTAVAKSCTYINVQPMR